MKLFFIFIFIFILLLSLVIIITICKNTISFFVDKKDNKYFNTYLNLEPLKNVDKINPEYANIKIYIINFEKDQDRKINMIKLMNKLEFENYNFVTPISPVEAKNHKYFKNTKIPSGTASNTLTFLNIFKNTPEDIFFVMEDDINIYSEVSINDILNKAFKNKFDVLYLEYCYIDDCNINLKLITKNLYQIYSPYCAACILYTKSFVNKIINIYENKIINIYEKNLYKDIISRGIDFLYHELFTIKNKNLKALAYPLFRQDPIWGSQLKTSKRYKSGTRTEFDKICGSFD